MNTLIVPLRPVLDALIQAGGTPLIVGGAVRDALLGLNPKDLDIEVHGLTPDALYAAVAPLGRINAVGRSFGVLKLRLPGGRELDIALPQRLSRNPSGERGFIPTPDPSLTPREAAARRDFTWNAMAFTADGQLVDFFGGQDDLRNRIIRHTSEAFDEDPLRVLRAMQFAARFSMRLAPETSARCQALLPEATTIPISRIWGEWQKWALRGQRPSLGLLALRECGWLALYPELVALDGCEQEPSWHPEGDVFIHTGHVCDAAAAIAVGNSLEEEQRTALLFAALCHDLGKPATTARDTDGRIRSPGHAEAGVEPTIALLERFGTPRRMIDLAVPLVREHMAMIHAIPNPRSVRRLAVRLAPATIADWRRLVAADASGRPPFPPADPGAPVEELAVQLDAGTGRPAPIVTGRHLMERGHPPGPRLGELLREIYTAQIDGEFTTLEEGLAWAERMEGGT
jgi:tRNA nucleotidyltransferase (CCA-adding enzyme)